MPETSKGTPIKEVAESLGVNRVDLAAIIDSHGIPTFRDGKARLIGKKEMPRLAKIIAAFKVRRAQ